MKFKILFSFLLIALISMASLSIAVAATEPSALTPYQLTATQMAEDEMHPYGSALLSFKINGLPSSTGDDTLTWYVNIEKKIGDMDWIIVSAIPSQDFIADHMQSTSLYTFEQLWIETYDWDGTSKISYRVQVVLEDLISNRGGSSNYSNVASIGLISSAWAVPELQKAESLGLIPDILKGTDLTKPVTREEFCQVGT